MLGHATGRLGSQEAGLPDLSRGKSANDLRHALEGTSHAWLNDMIHWEDAPRRSVGTLARFAILATVALPLIVGATAAAVAGLVMFVAPAVGIDSWLAEYFAVVPMAGAMILGIYATTSAAARARQELSKFPELALFGANAPTLYLRSFAKENAELDTSAGDQRLNTMIGLTVGLGSAAIIGGMTIMRYVNDPPRSFGDPLPTLDQLDRAVVDLQTSANVTEIMFWVSIGAGVALLARWIISASRDRGFETMLANVVGRSGMLICLTDPHLRRKTSEALRLRIRNEHWQETVDRLIATCNVVVLSYSAGANLDWEAERVLAERARSVIVHLPRLADDWEQSPGSVEKEGDWLSKQARRVTPEWLRKLLGSANSLSGEAKSHPSVVVSVPKNGDIVASRTRATAGDLSGRIADAMRWPAFDAIPNPAKNPRKVTQLKVFRSVTLWGPRVSYLMVTGIAVVALAIVYGWQAALIGGIAFVVSAF